MFRDIVQPRSKRNNRRGNATRGKQPTKISWDGWSFSGNSPANNPWDCLAVDQLVIRDKQQKDHPIRLYPNMRPEQLRQQIEQLKLAADGLEMRFVYTEDSDLKAYLRLFQVIWPNMRVEETLDASMEGAKVYQVPIYREFTVGVQYFQAIAKIAFHYYLVHSQHCWRGDEETFADIRDFIKHGKSKERYFHSSGKCIIDPCSPAARGSVSYVPKHWCHLLAADETRGTAGKTRFFVGRSPTQGILCYTWPLVTVNCFTPTKGHVYR